MTSTDPGFSELKKAIKNRLTGLGANAELHAMLMDLKSKGHPADADVVVQLLHQKGLVSHLAQQIGPPDSLLSKAMGSEDTMGGIPAPGRLLLHIKLIGGRAFTEYVARAPLPGERLTLHLELFGQRFSSSVVTAAIEPGFAGEAFIELPEEALSPLQEAQRLRGRNQCPMLGRACKRRYGCLLSGSQCASQ